jgi:hypothetical protein
VVAIVDYNPGQTDLLAFQKGDVGKLIKKADTGWWFITLKGFEGWVPATYWEEYTVIVCFQCHLYCQRLGKSDKTYHVSRFFQTGRSQWEVTRFVFTRYKILCNSESS